ncbi:DUF2786 domain-containing protein [Desulfotalea psychrophila]|uniref:DUF2786 domain-containing protein n=1 Tax=Desulfotalea psychrophila (strain LSv54 / DSM 12343) TaxID=177439 RepID=Q6AR01_DESPS|nr:DUF2786 domain-containing protein [Desulfotalea psychrophila]CAG35223.1 unknown protein [Desulfotalea psychrophila LSv54]
MKNNRERTWCIQLIENFETIIRERALSLETPCMEILSSDKKLGNWASATKTMGISKTLIEDYSWDVVIEILRHEMAHQYVSEVLKCTQVMPHGNEYQRACSILGVHPDYRGASTACPPVTPRPAEEKAHAQLAKVEKLLALAESAEEHEASAAMAKANRLIARYNLQLIADKTPQKYDYIQIKVGNKQVPAWIKSITVIIKEHFFVNTIIISQYDAKTDSTFKAVELIGNRENISIAAHVFHFLCARLPLLWNNFQKESAVQARERRSYYLGVIRGFKEKMDAGEKSHPFLAETGLTTSALILAQDQELQKFFIQRYPQTKLCRTKATKIYTASYNSGIGVGKKLTVHRPITNSQGNLGHLLPRP